jgi:hypothetical protein
MTISLSSKLPSKLRGRPACPNFLVTGITETPNGVLFRAQRLEDGSRGVLTADVRVLHLDQVAIQITRGGAFYVAEPRPTGPQAKLYRLEVQRGDVGCWTVRAVDVPGAAEALAALPTFPVLGVVRAPFACDAAERAWPPSILANSI